MWQCNESMPTNTADCCLRSFLWFPMNSFKVSSRVFFAQPEATLCKVSSLEKECHTFSKRILTLTLHQINCKFGFESLSAVVCAPHPCIQLPIGHGDAKDCTFLQLQTTVNLPSNCSSKALHTQLPASS